MWAIFEVCLLNRGQTNIVKILFLACLKAAYETSSLAWEYEETAEISYLKEIRVTLVPNFQCVGGLCGLKIITKFSQYSCFI